MSIIDKVFWGFCIAMLCFMFVFLVYITYKVLSDEASKKGYSGIFDGFKKELTVFDTWAIITSVIGLIGVLVWVCFFR